MSPTHGFDFMEHRHDVRRETGQGTQIHVDLELSGLNDQA